MLSSHHDAGIRAYFTSRSAARAACGKGERVERLGVFGNGSFGLYAPLKPNGQYVRGYHDPLITVWAVMPKRKAVA
jgi:hypothetical protein